MKLLKRILLGVLILAVVSNAYVHINEIVETRLNTTQTQKNSTIITSSNKLISGIFANHLNMIMDLYNKLLVPDFGRLAKGTVIVYDKIGVSGTGVCIKEDEKYYYVLSAQHIVVPRHKNNVISIRLADGLIYGGEVVKESEKEDLSLIRLTKSFEMYLNVIKISVNKPKVGETVYALGHPLELYYILTKGIVSSIDHLGFTISDITIAYGSSGGGLFNTRGELLGINVEVAHYMLSLGEDKKGKGLSTFAPVFGLTASIKLEMIKQFLKEYEEEKEAEHFADEIMKIPHF